MIHIECAKRNLITILVLATLIDTVVLPGKSHEVCSKLQSGEEIHWNFSSTSPVDFNLHHHLNEKVIMPVDKKSTKKNKGSFILDASNDWCLMWTLPKTAKKAAMIKGDWTSGPPAQN